MPILSSAGRPQGAASAGATAQSGRAGDGAVDVLAAFGGALANAIAALVPGFMQTPAAQIAAAANDNVAGGEQGDAGTTLESGSGVGVGTPSAAVFLRAGAGDDAASQVAGANAALATGAAPLTAAPAAAGAADTGDAAQVSTDPTVPSASPGEAAGSSGPGRPGHVAAGAGFNPAFRGRLERVIERMHDEYGIDVKVVEGLRSQARQDWLYEQGRTRPGPVVTWTHHSNHTQGLAADLQLANVGSGGYRTLAQVAEEEGLHTLGAADPGHVELRPGAAGLASSAETPAESGTGSVGVASAPSSGVATVAAVARPAAVADVARVAVVAQIARVAAPAVPGQRSARPRPSAPAVSPPAGESTTTAPARPVVPPESPEPSPDVGAVMASTDSPAGRVDKAAPTLAQPATAAATPPVAGKQEADGSADARNGGRRSTTPEGPVRAAEASTSDGNRVEAFGQPAAASGGTAHPTAAAHAAGGVDVAARVAQVQAALDGAELRPLSRVLLHLGDSAEDGSVRVSLRGSSVEASIALTDTGAAERLGERLGELRTALEQHGYETGPLAVRSAAAATDVSLSGLAATSDRVVAPAAPQSGSASQERRDGSDNRGAPQGGQDRPRPRREQRKENEA